MLSYSKNIATLLALAALSLHSSSLSAQDIEREHVWQASWITSADAPTHGQCVLHFRKQLDLAVKPARFNVLVSADNQFQLRVNGQWVGAGPSHSDLQHWKYETYDLAPLLHAGANLIAATVWNFGDDAPVRQISDRTGFVLDGEGEAEAALRTDASWEVEIEEGISTLPKPAEFKNFYYVASPAEQIDGTRFDWNWDQPTTTRTHSTWKPATLIGAASARGKSFAQTNWQLMPDSLPPMEMSEQPSGHVARSTGIANAGAFPGGPLLVPAHSEITLLIDAGHLTTAYPELVVARGAGSKVIMRYAEALYDEHGGKGNRNDLTGKHFEGIYDELRPDGAASRGFTPLDWRTWRYLQMEVKTGDAPLELTRLRTWFTAYPFQQAARFESNDPALTEIWNIGWRTARLCAHDTYMDTPYWERLQYTGDTRIQTLVSYTVAGDDRLARQAIEAFHNSTTSDGITLSHYPASSFQAIPGFSMYWVGMVHDYWMYRGGDDFVRAQLPVVRSTIDWFLERQNPSGLLGKLPWWPFVDWVDDFHDGNPPEDEHGDSAILSLQLVEALRYAAALESSLGNPDLAHRDTQAANRTAAAIYKLCWSGEQHLLADTPAKTHFSQHANAFAVWLDVIPSRDQRQVMTRVFSVTDPSFVSDQPTPPLSRASYYYRFYLSRALAHAGMGDRYLETLGPWKTMIANGLTTWAEQPEPSRSDSHAWSAHPNYDLLTIVAGIAPDEPGFKSARIEPHFGSLQHLHAVMPSPNGNIEVTYQVKSGAVDATIKLPATLKGNLIWNGNSLPLKAGTQHLILVPTTP